MLMILWLREGAYSGDVGSVFRDEVSYGGGNLNSKVPLKGL